MQTVTLTNFFSHGVCIVLKQVKARVPADDTRRLGTLASLRAKRGDLYLSIILAS